MLLRPEIAGGSGNENAPSRVQDEGALVVPPAFAVIRDGLIQGITDPPTCLQPFDKRFLRRLPA